MTVIRDGRPTNLRYLRADRESADFLGGRPKEPRDPVRVGIVGTGFVSRHFLQSLAYQERFHVGAVLTRRPLDHCSEYPAPELLTDSFDRLIAESDVILECTGDAIYATDVVDRVMAAGLPTVTFDSEFHVTAGSYFVGRGTLSEAHGDQPGCQAALMEEALELGFTPLVLGNMKGFLNHTPTDKDMRYWAKRNGISLPMVTSFTDGTKLQIEQVLVANGCGSTIARTGLLGPAMDDLRAAGNVLANEAKNLGAAISDYVLSSALPHGVFVVAEHGDDQHDCLRYFKLGDGPYYVLQKPNIFVHLEIVKTLTRVMDRGLPLLNNSSHPSASVAAVAKHALKPGKKIAKAIGSFELRGVAVKIDEYVGHVPIGLIENAVIRTPVAAGDVLSFDDVEIPESLALKAWCEIEAQALKRAETAPPATTLPARVS